MDARTVPPGEGEQAPPGTPTRAATFSYGLDLDGVVSWMGDDVVDVLGWTSSELVGRSAADLVHPEDLARGLSERREMLASGQTATAALRALCKGGRYAWLTLESRPELDADGATVGTSVRARALLHVDEMTPVLAEAESRYRMLALNTFDVVVHQVEGVIEWVSPSVVGLLGYAADELIGRRTLGLWHPDDVAGVVALRDRAVAGERGEGLFRLQHKDRRYVWIDVAAAPDGNPAPPGLVVSLRDATARVAAEADLRTRETEYRLLAENAGDIVFRAEPDGTYNWISPSVLAVLGYRPDEVVGTTLDSFLHPDDLHVRAEAIADTMPGETVRYVARLRHKDGGYRWLSIVGQPVVDEDGRMLARIGSARTVDDEVAAREALQTREAEYRLLAENAVDVVVRSRVDGVVEWVSPSITRVLGWSPDELVGRDFVELLNPDDRAQRDATRSRAAVGELSTYLGRYRHVDGGWVWMSVTGGPIVDEAGAVVGVVGSARDATAQVEARLALEASEALFRSVMQSSTVGMAVVGLDQTFRAVNIALCRLLMHDEAWLLVHHVSDLAHPDDALSAQIPPVNAFQAGDSSLTDVIRLVRSDGAVVWVRRTAVLVRDVEGEPLHLVVQLLDLTAERELEFQTFHDVLTGLRNRTWILDNLDEELRIARRSRTVVGVLFIDLDNFKVVNDSLGHTAGDEVLATVAQRLVTAMRPGDHIGRFGGDEFVVVIRDLDGVADLERVCERLIAGIMQPLVVQGHNVTPTASIGVAVSTLDSTSQSLLRDADSALYRAKSAGKQRWHFADEAMHAKAVARLTTEDELRRALARHELVVHYQPIVRLDSREIVGHEALVRWEHPERGLIPPLDFLPVAEESGLIVDIGDEVLEIVCRMLSARPGLAPVSVNMSPLQISRAGWRERFVATLRDHGVDPRRIVVEVTETAVLDNLDDVAAELTALRELGIGVHVDDFGTGFSSIALLRDLPISGIKLDMSFTRRLTGDGGTTEVLAEGLARLGQGLGLVGIAEGVETEEQARVLAAQGWPRGQGWLFGRPQPEPLDP